MGFVVLCVGYCVYDGYFHECGFVFFCLIYGWKDFVVVVGWCFGGVEYVYGVFLVVFVCGIFLCVCVDVLFVKESVVGSVFVGVGVFLDCVFDVIV